MNEAQTRLELIDPAIRAAGWTKANNCQMLVEQSACEFAPGRVGKVRGKALRADYILTYRGRRLVVVEAKNDDSQAIEGYEQALKYGRNLGMTAAYTTNGKEIIEVDRNILANQGLIDFSGFDEHALARVTPKAIHKRGDNVPTNATVFFTIYETLMQGTQGKEFYRQYAPDFFDFIIIDECHRGGAKDESTWRQILEYFAPAYQLGLTATPKRDVNADTYNYFGRPVYEYSLLQGIEDGFLTPFRVEKASCTIDDYEYDPDDTVVAGEDELDKDKTYEEKDFYHGRIKIRQRDEERVKELLGKMQPMKKRVERADAAKLNLSKWAGGKSAREFYGFVLENYVRGGVEVFSREDALSQLIVTKYHTIPDATRALGNLKQISAGFAKLQKEVYAA